MEFMVAMEILRVSKERQWRKKNYSDVPCHRYVEIPACLSCKSDSEMVVI